MVNDLVNQSNLHGCLHIGIFCRAKQALAVGSADSSGHMGRNHGWNDTQLHLRQCCVRLFGGNDIVTGTHQSESTAHGRTIHATNGELWQGCHGIHVPGKASSRHLVALYQHSARLSNDNSRWGSLGSCSICTNGTCLSLCGLERFGISSSTKHAAVAGEDHDSHIQPFSKNSASIMETTTNAIIHCIVGIWPVESAIRDAFSNLQMEFRVVPCLIVFANGHMIFSQLVNDGQVPWALHQIRVTLDGK
mmetsp:Transcript_66433/g.134868  ORF Transcript_66433/g.134868 Transcript_66433/m.134868 type:complete len:248 (+) Transcript_66433:434-1177(+)